MTKDLFGNLIDSEVGYARGEILKDSYSEKLKYQHALEKINSRVEKLGEDSLFIFTGNIRANQLLATDLSMLSEEWVGPSLFHNELKELAISHLGGAIDDEVAIFNRTSSGIISTILALTGEEVPLVSFAPNNKCHPSIVRGARLSRAPFYEVQTIEELKNITVQGAGVCILTGVTSELHLLDSETFKEAIDVAKSKGMVVIVDDAYGARVRTVVYHQPHALKAGADIVITNNDKAGLHGPRAGIMAGKKDLVLQISAKASENGMEARAPIALGVLRSLEKYQEEDLIEETKIGQEIYKGLAQEMGEDIVRQTILGPEINEVNLLKYILDEASIPYGECSMVPAEVSAAVGFVLLEKYGIITTNVCGMPGARVSIRLKSNKAIVDKFGGVQKVIDAMKDAIQTVSSMVGDPHRVRGIILGS